MALGALVAADSALEELSVNSYLGDAGLGPLVAALRHNSRLTTLNLSRNYMSAEFGRDVLLPAVRDNRSLRVLITESGNQPGPYPGEEAVELVESRAREHN